MTTSAQMGQLRVATAEIQVRTCERNVTFATTTGDVKRYSEELVISRDELKEAYAALEAAKKAVSVMSSSAVTGWGLQLASTVLDRAFSTGVSYGAPVGAALAV